MMKYMGSKRRLVKHIAPIIHSYMEPNTIYWEPFVGGGNMINEIKARRRAGSDACEHVISALTLIRDSIQTLPRDNTEFTEEDYNKIKQYPKHPLYGYVMYALSYGGKAWGGWSRDKRGSDYVAEAHRNAVNQHGKLQEVELFVSKYDGYSPAHQCVIYCDPPYRGTTKYRNSKDFDHDMFWDWARGQSMKGNTVLVSEYTAPEDFECIWEKEITSSLTKNSGSKSGIERLFKYRNGGK